MAARTRKKSAASAKSTRKRDPVSLEITGVIIIAVSVFLILSIYTESAAGRIGEILKAGFIGLFGFGAYIFPFIVIGVSLYILFSKNKNILPKKFAASGVLFLTAVIFTHVIFMDEDIAFESVGAYLAYYFKNGGAKNGGLIGAVFGNFLISVFSHVGTYIIIFSSALVCFIALTGKSFFKGLTRLVLIISDFFSASEEDYDDYEDYKEEAGVKSAKAEPKRKAEKAEPKLKTGPEPKPKQRNEKPRAEEKDPSAYTFEITSTAPSDRKVMLLNEEFSKNKEKDKGPVINLSKMTYEDALRRQQEEKEKRLLEEELGKPSVKLNMKGRKSKTSGGDGSKEAAAVAVKESLKAPEPDYGGKTEADEEYGGDILFNSAPAYDDIPEEFDVEDPDEKEIKPEIFVESRTREYVFPPIDLLNENPYDTTLASKSAILENSRKLEDALKSFRVEAKVMEVNVGPTVTRYELSPGVGVKVSSISNLADDLALNLAAAGVRIEAPIPGKAAVGIEVPNKEAQPVFLREVVSDSKFKTYPSKLAFALGKDITGNVVIADIAKMPHMLIAGSTGSGKSVCINTLVSSIIYKARPEEVKLLMVDPKVVELKVYNGIPHLLIPVVTDPKKAAGALNWAVREMTARYDLFAQTSVRDLKGYNQLCAEKGEETLPQIVIIIDELADLMMTAGKEVEEYICRLAQMARAAGIHLIIATQRPSVDVITGLIKANIPSKIAFAVSSAIDSRTILGESGAEKLLGRGDMLFYPTGMNKPLRVQGSFISDKEVEAIVSFVKQGASVEYDEKMIENITAPAAKGGGDPSEAEEDEFMEPAIEFIVKKEKASASMLQRQFRIGYNRASRIIEILEERGIVGPEDGSKPRKVLMTKYEWEDYNNRTAARE